MQDTLRRAQGDGRTETDNVFIPRRAIRAVWNKREDRQTCNSNHEEGKGSKRAEDARTRSAFGTKYP